MPDENEKVEDFISLWKKKLSTENTPSVIGDLQKENELLRSKITENIELISKSEEILKKAVEEKEKFRVEKDEAITELDIKMNKLTQENSELGSKVKSMVKLLLEKDEDIKAKDKLISNLQVAAGSLGGADSTSNHALVDELRAQIIDKNSPFLLPSLYCLQVRFAVLIVHRNMYHQFLLVALSLVKNRRYTGNQGCPKDNNCAMLTLVQIAHVYM